MHDRVLHYVTGQYLLSAVCFLIWNKIFLPLNFRVIYPDDIQTDCAAHNERISDVHDTIVIKIGTYL